MERVFAELDLFVKAFLRKKEKEPDLKPFHLQTVCFYDVTNRERHEWEAYIMFTTGAVWGCSLDMTKTDFPLDQEQIIEATIYVKDALEKLME